MMDIRRLTLLVFASYSNYSRSLAGLSLIDSLGPDA